MSATPLGKPTTVVIVGGGSIIAGKEIMMLELARGLREEGIGVEFITSLWGGKDEFVSRLQSEGFKYHRVRLGFISLSLKWKPVFWTLDQLRYWPSLVIGYLRAIGLVVPKAVIHTNWHHVFLLMPFLNRHRDIYWSHEIVLNKWHYRCVFRAIANRVSSMVCVSHAVARALVDLGIGPAKIVVIHNGVADLGLGRRNENASYTRFCVGIVGRIDAWKGHDDLIEAFRLLAHTHENLTLKIVGSIEGDFAISLRSRIAALGLDHRVVWAGYIKHPALIYADIDICVVPSRAVEALGMTAIEAGFCGLPVIATATGGLPEIVEDGLTGLLVPVGEPDKLAEAIDRLVRSPDLRRQMGERGRERMQRLFSQQRFIQEFNNQLRHDVHLHPERRS